MASEDFDVNRLTERQQVAYFAAKNSDSDNPLLSSPFRIDQLMASQSPSSTSKLSSQIDINITTMPSSPSSYKTSRMSTPYSMSPMKSPKAIVKPTTKPKRPINHVPIKISNEPTKKNIKNVNGDDDISDYISQLETLRELKQKIFQTEISNRMKNKFA